MFSTRISAQNIVRGRAAVQIQRRSLHLTGAVKNPSYVLGTEKQATPVLPTDIAGLRAACEKQGLNVNGNKADLLERLNAHSIRQFSSISTQRPAADPRSSKSRAFNTSRELRKPGDSSTIDFMYFPSDVEVNLFESEVIRVPILPDNNSVRRVDVYKQPVDEDFVQKPTIAVIGGESTHVSSPSAMAEVHDNADSADRHFISEIAGQVSDAARQVAIGAEKQGEIAGGVAKQIWKGFIDDVFGVKRKQLIV